VEVLQDDLRRQIQTFLSASDISVEDSEGVGTR
jgi:hypothetical protein